MNIYLNRNISILTKVTVLSKQSFYFTITLTDDNSLENSYNAKQTLL